MLRFLKFGGVEIKFDLERECFTITPAPEADEQKRR